MEWFLLMDNRIILLFLQVKGEVHQVFLSLQLDLHLLRHVRDEIGEYSHQRHDGVLEPNEYPHHTPGGEAADQLHGETHKASIGGHTRNCSDLEYRHPSPDILTAAGDWTPIQK